MTWRRSCTSSLARSPRWRPAAVRIRLPSSVGCVAMRLCRLGNDASTQHCQWCSRYTHRKSHRRCREAHPVLLWCVQLCLDDALGAVESACKATHRTKAPPTAATASWDERLQYEVRHIAATTICCVCCGGSGSQSPQPVGSSGIRRCVGSTEALLEPRSVCPTTHCPRTSHHVASDAAVPRVGERLCRRRRYRLRTQRWCWL